MANNPPAAARAASPRTASNILEGKVLQLSMELMRHDEDSPEYEDVAERLNVMQEELRQRREIERHEVDLDDAGFPSLDLGGSPTNEQAVYDDDDGDGYEENVQDCDASRDQDGFPTSLLDPPSVQRSTSGGDDFDLEAEASGFDFQDRIAPPLASGAAYSAQRKSSDGMGSDFDGRSGVSSSESGPSSSFMEMLSGPSNGSAAESGTKEPGYRNGNGSYKNGGTNGRGGGLEDLAASWVPPNDTTVDTTLSAAERGAPVALGVAVEEDPDAPAPLAKGGKCGRRAKLASTLLFVLGSVLYLWMSVIDYRWANELLNLPVWLRTADDDIAWANYRLEERHNASMGVGRLLRVVSGTGSDASGASGVVGGAGRGGAGVRRMKMRELWMLEREEKEEAERMLLEGSEVFGLKIDNHGKKEKKLEARPLELNEEDGKKARRLAKAAKKKARLEMETSPAVISESSPSHDLLQRKLQTPEELYYDECWAFLPPEIQDAYAILGYTEEIWDDEEDPPAEALDWIELTDEQREAALFIGYTEEIWCETKQPSASPVTMPPVTMSPATISPAAGALTGGLVVAASPASSPASVPVTSGPSGVPTFNPVTSSPTDQPTLKPVTSSPTNSPTPEPTNGPAPGPFDPARSDPTESPVASAGTPSDAGVIYWDDIPPGVRSVYEQLGYTKALWDSGTKLGIDSRSWDELSFRERFAVISIGYTKESWDGTPDGERFASQPAPVEVEVVDGGGGADGEEVQWWSELQPHFQEIYASLGYDEALWNAGGKVPIDDKTWAEMTFDERLAVYSIGFTEEDWDAKGRGEHFGTQPTSDMSPPTTSPGTLGPTSEPTLKPVTASPVAVEEVTAIPTVEPTRKPVTASPVVAQVTLSPTAEPTAKPIAAVTSSPTSLPTEKPVTTSPTTVPTLKPVVSTEVPTQAVTQSPTKKPTTNLFVPTPPTTPSVTPDAPTPEVPTTPTPEELYYEEDWADLPPEIQDAYSVLGYTGQMWDNGIEPYTNTMDWPELTEEQRQAALFIGYTEEAWCETFQPTTAPTPKPTTSAASPNATFAGFFDPPPTADADDGPTTSTEDGSNNDGGMTEDEKSKARETYYEDYDWEELPPEVQEAAAILGYDQKLWDMDGLGWSEGYDWDELNAEEQEAAALLGYDKESWDSIESVDGISGAERAPGEYESADDDYVFEIESLDDVWVSRYQILYFFAALSFVFVGLLDLLRERRAFHTLMILAGAFGVASSVFVEEDIRMSNILNCVSVHLFLLEAITLFGEHKRSSISLDASKWVRRSVMLGDLEFGAGALIDVVLSYFFLFDETADWDVPLQIAGIVAGTLWLHCSLIYLGAFFYYPEAKSVKDADR